MSPARSYRLSFVTTTMVDLGPPTRRLANLVRRIPDDALDRTTPCRDRSLGALLDHVDGLAVAFRMAAQKTPLDAAPSADSGRLGDDWRTRIPAALEALSEAWRDPEAWGGMTAAGGVDLPGEVAGLVALDEVVVHGWDVARASGQPYDVPEEELEAVLRFVAPFSEPGQEAAREGLFGPVVAVPDDAPLLDRVLGLTGRDPSWAPPVT